MKILPRTTHYYRGTIAALDSDDTTRQQFPIKKPCFRSVRAVFRHRKNIFAILVGSRVVVPGLDGNNKHARNVINTLIREDKNSVGLL